jgi:hypothetical protein
VPDLQREEINFQEVLENRSGRAHPKLRKLAKPFFLPLSLYVHQVKQPACPAVASCCENEEDEVVSEVLSMD